MSGFLPNNGSGGSAPSGPAGGDLSGSYPNPTAVKLQGNAVKSGALSATQDGYALTWTNANSDWEAKPIPSTTFVTMTGDVVGASNANTVTGVTGKAATNTPLNAPTGQTVNVNINSTTSLSVSNNTISLAQVGTAYTISQPTQTSDAACNTLSITPQAPFASATGTHRQGGALAINLAAPSNSGSVESYIQIFRSGTVTPIGVIGAALNAPTFGFSLSGGVSVPTVNEENIWLFSNATHINGPTSGGIIKFYANGGAVGAFTTGGFGGSSSGVPLVWQQQAVTIAASGTTTLTGAQQQASILNGNAVALTGAITIDFGGITGGWDLDLSGVTSISTTAGSGNTVSVKNGTTTKEITNMIKGKTETAGSGCLMIINCSSANSIAIG